MVVALLSLPVVLGPIAVLILGLIRLTGRRTRFDHLVETFGLSASAGVYPPSLLPPAPIEDEEVD
jgi:hypothetical protein